MASEREPDPDRERGIPRREFAKAALAIGGTSALAACLNRASGETSQTTTDGTTTTTTTDPAMDLGVPTGVEDTSVLPDRQHAWNEFLVRDPVNNTVMPQHQLILLLNYVGDGPTEAERRQVESAFRGIERAVQWGTWRSASAVVHRGILFMLGYSPAFFQRQYGERPAGVDLQSPSTVIDRLGEDATADDYDAVLITSSDYTRVLLGVEEALFGDLDSLNGVDMPADLNGVFEVADRRTGFVGRGLPADKLDVEEIPEDAPLSMGFKSGYADNQATEDRVTIQSGPFAGGTTTMVSRLELGIEDWYEKSDSERVHCMFSPHHSLEGVGETGKRVGRSSGVTEQMVDQLDEDAADSGCIGHSQKVARARDEDFEPRILRRSEGDSTGPDGPAMNFSSVQRTIEAFVDTRAAMSNEAFEGEVPPEKSGIVDFVDTQHRGTFLIPTREDRALPKSGRS